jgi:hypothetical protein
MREIIAEMTPKQLVDALGSTAWLDEWQHAPIDILLEPTPPPLDLLYAPMVYNPYLKC